MKPQNSQSGRLAAKGEPTGAELSAVRQDYQRHLQACARIGCPPENFVRFFAEWRDTRRDPDEPAVDLQLGPSRDYSDRYSSGDFGGREWGTATRSPKVAQKRGSQPRRAGSRWDKRRG